ncbi:NfeD family protein [Magnetospirillum sp. UT-4]|uniref:NfeD family protein n=1 Tax=Magnetospirillum sp. UT-4 TaxID=2681467 RepID=UPI001381636B|nr:NfeD family protein [Magnetospirillum sp. UT-4]CAA7624550.1 conserved hypothetical protein; putative inner membrane protein [Magnetospirillum sp. UT-4]
MHLVFWHWLTLGVVLVAVETVMPGAYLLFPGIAALAVGIVAYAAPDIGWEIQALAFAALSLAAAILGRRLYGRLRAPAADEPHLNRRGEALVGGIHTLDMPIKDGRGRLRVADGTWPVTGPDLPAGARVKVVGVDGITLRVEAKE